MNIPNNVFIFNLGRLWQGVVSERWDEAEYLTKFIKEITPTLITKKCSKELKKLNIAVENKDSESVDRVLKTILKW
ncbi:MAG: hypothetical protein CVU80_00185 [Elusimicrobia bacterium HGW-Elusimicrobia-4]|nr:MAG: hypothetical protein CVU80_00185 [Elusimicrobia bacterium HGW-Elusimicrobia-4]